MSRAIIFLLFSCLSACSLGKHNTDTDTTELDKIYIGQYYENPIFFVKELGSLVTLKDKNIKHFKSILSGLTPLFICDKYIFYKLNTETNSNQILRVVNNATDEVVLDIKVENRILSLVASRDGQVVFFSDGYDTPIKRLDILSSSFSSTLIIGEVSFLSNNTLYFLKYPGNETVEPIVDLIACDFRNDFKIKRILPNVFDGSLVIASDNDEYVLCKVKNGRQFHEVVMTLAGSTVKELSNINFVDFCGGYYSKSEKCFKLFSNPRLKSTSIIVP
jgi:hypothetical protein